MRDVELDALRAEVAALRERVGQDWWERAMVAERELAEARELLARRQFCRCGCGIFEHDMVSAWEDDVRAFLRRDEARALRQSYESADAYAHHENQRAQRAERDLAEARALLARLASAFGAHESYLRCDAWAANDGALVDEARAFLRRADVAEGLAQSARGEVHDLGSFAEYARDEARRCTCGRERHGYGLWRQKHLDDCPARDERPGVCVDDAGNVICGPECEHGARAEAPACFTCGSREPMEKHVCKPRDEARRCTCRDRTADMRAQGIHWSACPARDEGSR